MLKKLSIRNYAIIDELELKPDEHLNIVTGETGAGKSIILGALALILGERADTSVLINKQEKCVVEAYFDISDNKDFIKLLEKEGLDYEATCIIRREIGSNGKSRAFVNDSPVTLDVLNRLTSLLVDLQQQFAHLALEDDLFQLDVIDAIAQNQDLKNTYSVLYENYRKITRQLTEYRQQQAQLQKEADYKQFLFDELLQAEFKADEIEQAELQLKQMAHAERIISALQSSRAMLEEGEQPLINELKRVNQQLQSITDVMPATAVLQQRILSAHAELKDIASELESMERSVSLDQELMQQLQERVDLGYKLLKKHALPGTNDLLLLQEKLDAELKASTDLAERIETLNKEQEAVYKQMLGEATKLSATRKKAIPGFTKRTNELLALVGMPNARFEVSMKEQPASFSGMDNIRFLLDANKSGHMAPLEKAASGGEMSRIMLCIKSQTAKAMHMPTLIFDEVDTGISGEAARQVSILLRELSGYHQLICITHQPQVAARGTTHFYVYKDEDKNKRITTKVRVLKNDERILTIARMIGGEKPSDAAIKNANELVEG